MKARSTVCSLAKRSLYSMLARRMTLNDRRFRLGTTHSQSRQYTTPPRVTW